MPEKQFHEIKYPSSRQLTFDMGKIGMARHHIKALLEVDVTEAWNFSRQSRRTGKKLSFFPWVVKTTADCVTLHPPVAGFNLPGRNKVVYFDDVDVSIMVEKEVNGSLVPLPYVVRKANEKTVYQIQEEIETVKTQAVKDEGNYVLGEGGSAFWMRLFIHLPQLLRISLFRLFLNHPQRAKNAMGTVMITTAGLVGHSHAWFLPYSIHPLCVTLGSINEQPRVYHGEIEKRQVLHLALLIDHDVIDGMPAGRFVEDLVRKLESGYELEIKE